ncbi:hypothetical protein HY837_00675 [archaeon]|nr:hypothetical protein [archaeon]
MKLQDIVKQTTRFQENDELFIAEFNNGFHVVYEKDERGLKYALLPLVSRTRGFFANYYGTNLATGESQSFSGKNWEKVSEQLGTKTTRLHELEDKTLELYDTLKNHLGVRKIKTRNWSEALGGLAWSVSLPVAKPFVLVWRGLQRLTGANAEANIYDVPLVCAPIIFGHSLYELVAPSQDFFLKIFNKKSLHKKPQTNTDVAIDFNLGKANPNKCLSIDFIFPDGNKLFYWHINGGNACYPSGTEYQDAPLYFTETQEVIDDASNLLAEKTKLEKDHKDFEEQLKSVNHEEFLKWDNFIA